MSYLQRAFPSSRSHFREAVAWLRNHDEEPVHYSFSYPVARWLARRCPGELRIDWDEVDDTSRLDELLAQLLEPAEDEYFDSGWVSSRDWIDMARAGSAGTDFDWLMAQLADKRLKPMWTQLYDAAEIPLVWDVARSRFARSRNMLKIGKLCTRENGMRKRPRAPKKEIEKPLRMIQLPVRDGTRLIDAAMASLAVRYRETYHFNYANPREVYLAHVGEGIAIAVFGLLPEHRFALECTMGYLVLSNGVPIGYGGASALFRQVNTGVNIFDEFRGSEAAYIWTQVMRAYHSLTGCTRFIANPYQFGGDNSEALKSGAFWFYYRLGYRPVLPAVRKLAKSEFEKIRRGGYRCDIKTLRKLASCDMHLALPGARAGEYFDERWFDTVSMLATTVLGDAGGKTRRESAKRVASSLARDLGMRSGKPGSERLAPIIAAVNPGDWSRAEKRRTRDVWRAKDGEFEARYAKLLAGDDKLLISLKNACRRADAE
jgi:hypothetical protein